MDTKLAQWGNSLAVRIPRSLAKELQWTEGQEVELQILDGVLTLRPQKPKRLRLDDLLAKVSDENIHSEFDWGQPMGLENW